MHAQPRPSRRDDPVGLDAGVVAGYRVVPAADRSGTSPRSSRDPCSSRSGSDRRLRAARSVRRRARTSVPSSATTTTRSLAANPAGRTSALVRASLRDMSPSDAPSESINVTPGRCVEQSSLRLRAPRDTRRRDRREPAQVPAGGLGLERLEQRARERVADDRQHPHLLALDRVPHRDRVETGLVDQHHRAAARQRRQGDEQAGSVHERAGGQHRRRGAAPLDRAPRRRWLGTGPGHLPQRRA